MTCGRKLGDHGGHGARPGLRSRLGSRTVEFLGGVVRMLVEDENKLWHLAESDLQCGPSSMSVSASCVVERPGRSWLWWSGFGVFTCV